MVVTPSTPKSAPVVVGSATASPEPGHSTLMRIQGIQSSLDYNLNYDILPEKGLACLAGNSCAGTSFGKALMASFAMSATMSSPTLFRMRRAGSDEEVERATAIESIAKRYKASSALGALLALADT